MLAALPREAPSLFQRRASSGLAETAALKQSTALSYSSERLKRMPSPHCTSASGVGPELTRAACEIH